MGEGDKRRTRRAARYSSRELAVLSKKQSPSTSDWDDRVAAGSQKLPVALVSRTKTVDDPLTTRILAEVARRTSTIEVSADQIDQIDQIDETGLVPAGDPAPDDPT